MSDLATHMRITGLQVTNDDVNSRAAAVTSLKNSWKKSATHDFILAKVTDVAVALGGDGTPSESLGKEVETAVRKKASAFLYVERPLEVGVVAAMAVIAMMAREAEPSGWQIEDIWAAALWSALSFQSPLNDPKREALRTSVLKVARERSIAGAQRARERSKVPEFGEISFVDDGEGDLGNAFKKATAPTIEALRRNAALDREELDFLWWMMLNRSRVLKRSLDSLGEVARVVAAGMEGAEYLRYMPCDCHREIVLRSINANPVVSLAGVLASLGKDRDVLADFYAHRKVGGNGTVFPLITAIIAGKAEDTPASMLERNAEEWGGRALLEAAILKLWASGPGKL